METVEAYFERKTDELGLLNDCLKAPLSLKNPRSVSEVVRQKFHLTAALKAEHALGDWTATETAWAPVPHRSGPFEFRYDYQRADLEVRGPSFYDLEPHRVQETIYTSSGMAAIAALLFASVKLIDRATIFLAPGCYGETRELIEGYARHLRPIIHNLRLEEAARRLSACQILVVDSSAPASTFETALRLTRPAVDLLIFDTTCFSAASGQVRRVFKWAQRWRVPLVMVRSHTKLDSIGAEYGRLGSAVFLDWAASPAAESKFRSLPGEMRNAVRLLGGAALPAHFPPFVGTPSYRELTNKRMGAILRNTRRASRFFATAPGLAAQLRFAHGLYVTLKSAETLSEQTAREAAAAMSEDLGRAGLPIRHAGSFGFDFATTEWFCDPASGEYFIRVSVPDLPTALWDDLMEAIVGWSLTRERRRKSAPGLSVS
jgi:hypothetical protein